MSSQSSMGSSRRWVPLTRVVVYVNAAIVAVLSFVLFFFHGVALTQQEPILATRVGDLYLAFAVTLVLVATGFQRDRKWLLVAFVVNLGEFLNALVQGFVRIANINAPTDPALIPPLVLTGIFSLFYAVAYFKVRHQEPGDSAAG